jgi:hypothetical protein
MIKWVEADGDLRVLVLTTSWCEYCDKQLEEIKGIDDEFKEFEFIHEDADERPDLAIRYSPQIYPSISIISKEGVMGGTYGFVTRDKVVELLNYARKVMSEGKLVVPPKITKEVKKLDPNYVFNSILSNCEGYFDWIEGGFEREPKFVSPEVLLLFMKFDDFYHQSMVTITLDKAIENLWGNPGFYLYSKTIDWKEPYMVKMADFNSLMIIALLKAYEKYKDEKYLDYAVKTGEFILSLVRKDGLIENGITLKGWDNRAFLSVNAIAGEALSELYEFTKDTKFKDEVDFLKGSLLNADSHLIGSRCENVYLMDLAYLLYFTRDRVVLNTLRRYESASGAYYDITLEFAKRQRIGRFKFLLDNSILSLAFLRMGDKEYAKRIVDDLLESYGIYTYFNQAVYALTLGEIYGKFSS